LKDNRAVTEVLLKHAQQQQHQQHDCRVKCRLLGVDSA